MNVIILTKTGKDSFSVPNFTDVSLLCDISKSCLKTVLNKMCTLLVQYFVRHWTDSVMN